MNPTPSVPPAVPLDLAHILYWVGILVAVGPAGDHRPEALHLEAPPPGQGHNHRLGRCPGRIDEEHHRSVVPPHRPGRRPEAGPAQARRSSSPPAGASASWASFPWSSSLPGWPARSSTSTSTASSTCRRPCSRTPPRSSSTSWASWSPSTTSASPSRRWSRPWASAAWASPWPCRTRSRTSSPG